MSLAVFCLIICWAVWSWSCVRLLLNSCFLSPGKEGSKKASDKAAVLAFDAEPGLLCERVRSDGVSHVWSQVLRPFPPPSVVNLLMQGSAWASKGPLPAEGRCVWDVSCQGAWKVVPPTFPWRASKLWPNEDSLRNLGRSPTHPTLPTSRVAGP